MSNLINEPADEWLARQFEFEFCEECSGDACHHTAIPFLGNWFARCDFPPEDDGTPHETIQQYRKEST